MIRSNHLPKASGVHRQAAIALYRALVSQCRRISLPEPDRSALINVVRNRFRTTRPQRLRLALAFQSGYTALDLLDGSVAGDKASTARIASLLERTPDKLKQPHERKLKWPKKEPKFPASVPEEYKFENVFPRETVEGIRKVPFFVNANGFPYVRHKNKQSPIVSHLLTNLIRNKTKWYLLLSHLEEDAQRIAELEDDWEYLIWEQSQQEKTTPNVPNPNMEESFVESVQVGAQHVLGKIEQMAADSQERGLRFARIVWREQELADEERAARQALRKTRL